MKPKSFLLIVCLLSTSFGFGQTTTFSTPGAFTYTVPNYEGPFQPGDIIEKIELTVTIVGGGGGGGRGPGAGGGGGAQVRVVTFEVNSGNVLTGFVGTGGSGGINPNTSGSNGTASNFNGFVASGGVGGAGGNAAGGGNSGAGLSGGNGSINGARRAGGGGAGSGQNGGNGASFAAPPRAVGGNGGSGIGGFGGGGGGAVQGGTGMGNNIFGIGIDGGTNGSGSIAQNATNGGGGGGGVARGGNGGNGLVIITINFSILPVEFLGVKATFLAQNQSAKIEWSTAKEWNNSHFEIERSIGGIANFQSIGIVDGAGWSEEETSYQFEDYSLPKGQYILYYRIRQVDFDGGTSYSKVVSVEVDLARKFENIWQAYPNPVRDNQVNVRLLDYSEFSGEKIQASIVHTSRMVASEELGSVEELNAFLQQQISKIPKGVFVIEIQWGQKVEHIKVMKTN